MNENLNLPVSRKNAITLEKAVVMSDENDDKLLEEDGDYEDYEDLGEGDEEALLREDEPDEYGDVEDILELEAGQDDLDDSEIQDGAYDQNQIVRQSTYTQSRASSHMGCSIEESPSHEFRSSQDSAYQEDETPSRNLPEDEEEEEEEEDAEEEAARGRFRSERNSSAPLKSNSQSFSDIPDNLDQVIPDERNKPMQGITRIQRGNWGRGGRGRGSPRGNMSNFRGGPSNRGQVRGGRQPHNIGRNQRANYHNHGQNQNAHGMANVTPNMKRGFVQNFGSSQGSPMNSSPMQPTMGAGIGPPNMMPSMEPHMGHNFGPMGSHMNPQIRSQMIPPMSSSMGSQPPMGHHMGHPMGHPLMGSNMGPNMGPNMGGPNMGGPNMGGPNMGGPNMGGPNMGGPNMGGPNMGGPNMGGPNMGGPNMGGPNMGGPNMGGPNMGGLNMGGPNMGHNMGPNLGPNMGHNIGPNMGHNLGPSLSHNMGSMVHNMVPNMAHNMGPNMLPNFVPTNVRPPNMGHPNMGTGGQQFSSHLNMGAPNANPQFSTNQNINPSYGPNMGPNPNVGHNPSQGYRPGNFAFGMNISQSEQFSPIQRVIYNAPQNPVEPTMQRANPEESASRPNQVVPKIHINPRFVHANMHASEGRPMWDNQMTPEWHQSNSNINHHTQASFPNQEGPLQPHNVRQVQHKPVQQTLIQPQKPPQHFQSPSGRGGMKGQSPGSRGDVRIQQYSPPKRSLASSPGVIPRKQVRLETKHGKAHNSNLHEVRTVDTLPVMIDTLPDTTTTNESQQEDPYEDEETREYRKKIEEQKRLREKLLREKEERRRKAALEKQREGEPSVLVDSSEHEQNIPGHAARDIMPTSVQAISTIVNRNPPHPSNQSPRKQQFAPVNQITQPINQGSAQRGRGIARGRGGPGRGGQIHNRLNRGGKTATVTSASTSSTRLIESPASSIASPFNNSMGYPKSIQRGGRIVVMRGGGAQQQANTASQRVVRDPQEVNTRTVVESNDVNNQNESNVSTAKTVTVENLANSTNETQLRMMCNCIGRVESIKLDHQNQCAKIRFATAESASAFVKRYQRRMIDLSLIKVALVND